MDYEKEEKNTLWDKDFDWTLNQPQPTSIG